VPAKEHKMIVMVRKEKAGQARNDEMLTIAYQKPAGNSIVALKSLGNDPLALSKIA